MEVGAIGDELPPQVTVTAVAMTVATKRGWRNFKICPPPTTTWVQTPILPLAGRERNARGGGRFNGDGGYHGDTTSQSRADLISGRFPPGAGTETIPS